MDIHCVRTPGVPPDLTTSCVMGNINCDEVVKAIGLTLRYRGGRRDAIATQLLLICQYINK